MSEALALLDEGPPAAPHTILFAHGAGAPMDTPFMSTLAAGLADHGHRVVRFEFPYMARRRDDGRKRPPDALPRLLDAFRAAAVACAPANHLVVAGKSMGGRVASLLADELGARALIVFGYPFHPPGRPDRLRTEHLATLGTPGLIVQGERDPFGTPPETAAWSLPASLQLHASADGDHSLVPRKASGRSADDNWRDAVDAAHAFLRGLDADR